MQTSSGPKTFYICNVGHHHDIVYSQNVSDYLTEQGIRSKTITLKSIGQAPELRECLSGDAMGVLGFDCRLDHSWIGSNTFLDLALQANVPTIQWILDHPSSRIGEFNNSTPANAKFLFSAASAERYFNRFCIPGALTAHVACVGPSRHSRAEGLDFQTFAARPIICLLAMNLRRIGGTLEDAKKRLAALGPPISEIVEEAIRRAYPDLVEPVEWHFERLLDASGLSIADSTRHTCVQIVEEIVQITRRQKVFEVARTFPVLIQSDEASRPFQAGATARFEENVDMTVTWARLKAARAQVSVSNMHDMTHDRILNGLNAGCLNIVEDSAANRRRFRHGRNALFFRYDDNSLAECLRLVCGDVQRSYEIAAGGFAMRDKPAVRFGNFRKIVELTQGRRSLRLGEAWAEVREKLFLRRNA